MTIADFLLLSLEEQDDFIDKADKAGYRIPLFGTHDEVKSFLNNPEVQAIKDRVNFAIFDDSRSIK